MQKWSKLVVILVIVFPLVFFLSMAFRSGNAAIVGDQLIIDGAGGLEIELENISDLRLENDLPELANNGSFSLGLVKKGDFRRVGDNSVVRVVKNGDAPYIHLMRTGNSPEVYFNLSDAEDTRKLFSEIRDSIR